MASRVQIGLGASIPSAPTVYSFPFTISGTLAVGDVVCLVAGSNNTVKRAKADDATARPPLGIVTAISGATCSVAGPGMLAEGLTGLVAGTTYYLSTTAGGMVSTVPTYPYIVGVAISTTRMQVVTQPQIGVVPRSITDLGNISSGTLSINAALADIFTCTLTASATLAFSGASDGRTVTVRIRQDATGSRTLTFPASVSLGPISSPALTTTANALDILGFQYSAALTKWCFMGFAKGYV